MEVPHIITGTAYSAYESKLEKEVKAEPIPSHIAMIMDGNRRYAKEVLNAEPIEGHRVGKDRLNDVLHWCLEIGVRCLTVYAFSTENFNREQSEVDGIMNLLEEALYEFSEDPDVHKYKVRINIIGDRDLLPENVLKAASVAEEKTGHYQEYLLNMAVAYGGRQDIVNAVRSISQKVKEGEIDVDDIDENLMSTYISTNGIPDPELVLRTSGEIRISNFLLWQMAYSELYFTDICWPGFRRIDLLRAIRTYQQRNRRFGA